MNIEFMCGLLANYSKELSEAETYRKKGEVQLKHAKLILNKLKNSSTIAAGKSLFNCPVCDDYFGIDINHKCFKCGHQY